MSIKEIQQYNRIFRKFGVIKRYDKNRKKYKLNTFKSIPFEYKGIIGLIDNVGNIYLMLSTVSFYICGDNEKLSLYVAQGYRYLFHRRFIRFMRLKLYRSNVRGSDIYKYMSTSSCNNFYQLNAISCILSSVYQINAFANQRPTIRKFMYEMNSGHLVDYAKKCYKQHLQRPQSDRYDFEIVRHHTPITDNFLEKILDYHGWLHVSSSVDRNAVKFLKKNHIWK